MKNRDIIIGLMVLVGSVIVFLSGSIADEPRAAIFPKVVLCIMGALALMLIIQGLILKRKVGRGVVQGAGVVMAKTAGEKFMWRPVVFTFLAIVVYFGLLEKIGFYVASFLFFVVTVCVLDRKDLTPRKGLARCGYAFVFTAILYVLFNVILSVQTPRGLFI